MDSIIPPSPQKPQLREILRMALLVIIGAGVLIMLMRDALADIPHARTGVAVLTAIALVGFYLSEKKN